MRLGARAGQGVSTAATVAAALLLTAAVAPPSGLSQRVFDSVEYVIETGAPSAQDGAPLAFRADTVTGEARLGPVLAAPEGRCRGFTVSTIDTAGSAEVRGQYAGQVCLVPSTQRWTLLLITSGEAGSRGFSIPPAPGQAATNPYPRSIPPRPQLSSVVAQPSAQPPQPPPPPPPPAPLPPPPSQASAGEPRHVRHQHRTEAPTASDTAVALAPDAAAKLGFRPKTPPSAAAPAAPAAPPPGVITAESAQITRQLQSMPIRYNKPDHLSVDANTPISLVIETQGAGTGAEALKNLPGQQVAASALLSTSVTARLTGDGNAVQISARAPDTQTVTTVDNVQWIWNVQGKKPGQTTLTLAISANVLIGGKPTWVPVRTYTDKFGVSIGVLSRAKYDIAQIDPVWKFLGLGTPVAILTGLVVFLRRAAGRRPKPASGPSGP